MRTISPRLRDQAVDYERQQFWSLKRNNKSYEEWENEQKANQRQAELDQTSTSSVGLWDDL